MAADVLAPWVEYAIEAFGVDRCLFASNFPVDGLHGSFDQLYSSYAAVTADLDDQARLGRRRLIFRLAARHGDGRQDHAEQQRQPAPQGENDAAIFEKFHVLGYAAEAREAGDPP